MPPSDNLLPNDTARQPKIFLPLVLSYAEENIMDWPNAEVKKLWNDLLIVCPTLNSNGLQCMEIELKIVLVDPIQVIGYN